MLWIFICNTNLRFWFSRYNTKFWPTLIKKFTFNTFLFFNFGLNCIKRSRFNWVTRTIKYNFYFNNFRNNLALFNIFIPSFSNIFDEARRHYRSPVGRLWGRALNVDYSEILLRKIINVFFVFTFWDYSWLSLFILNNVDKEFNSNIISVINWIFSSFNENFCFLLQKLNEWSKKFPGLDELPDWDYVKTNRDLQA